MYKFSWAALLLGLLLDRIFGDPKWIYHPVCLIGSYVEKLKNILLREEISDRRKYRRGAALWLLTVPVFFLASFFILRLVYRLSTAAGFVLEAFWCFQMLAAHSLKKESGKVYESVADCNLEQSRYRVSMIVGRDTKDMDFVQVIKAAVETVAENTSDGVIAPMFFMFLMGAPGGFLYKAVNTLDSMVGYKNEKYMFFGRFSAKADDLFNFIPARISAVCMIAASFVLRFDWKNAVRIYRRDRRNHASPNSAQTESVCAGALGIRLGGGASYFGTYVEKPSIGDGTRTPEKEDIIRACRLMDMTWMIFALILVLISCIYFTVA